MTMHNAKGVFLQSNELNAFIQHEQISNSNGKNIRKYTIALEYFLECLENPDKEEDKGTFILGLEQVYLMANYDFIKDVVLK